MKKRAIFYVRVSTLEQSTEMQIRELEAYAKLRDWEVVGIYDETKTGTHKARPEFQKLLAAVPENQFDIVVVWKLDRWSRSMFDLLETLKLLDRHQIEFISLKDNFDLTTSTGRLMFQILGAFAEFEASILSERTKAGLANARANGKQIGRRAIVPKSVIKETYAATKSTRQTARLLGISRGAVHWGLAS